MTRFAMVTDTAKRSLISPPFSMPGLLRRGTRCRRKKRRRQEEKVNLGEKIRIQYMIHITLIHGSMHDNTISIEDIFSSKAEIRL